LEWAGYLIYYSFNYFPKGSIHVIVVDPGVGSSRQIKLIKSAGHYFLCPDNGLITKVFEQYKSTEIWAINNRDFFLSEVSHTFHGRDIFAPVAAHLSKGVEPSLLGERTRELKTLTMPYSRLKDGKIEGQIIHVDQFGNMITNIEKRQINKITIFYRELTIHLPNKIIRGIGKSYTDVKEGEILAIFGSKGLMEISVNKGNASEALGLNKGDKLKIIH
jgi:hypothetical protein